MTPACIPIDGKNETNKSEKISMTPSETNKCAMTSKNQCEDGTKTELFTVKRYKFKRAGQIVPMQRSTKVSWKGDSLSMDNVMHALAVYGNCNVAVWISNGK